MSINQIKERHKLEAVLCNPKDAEQAKNRFKGLEVVLHELCEIGSFYVSSKKQIDEICKTLTISNFNKN